MSADKDALNFDRLARKHREMEDRLLVLAGLRFPSESEQLEEAKLKKQKLKVKDEMELILAECPELAGRNG